MAVQYFFVLVINEIHVYDIRASEEADVLKCLQHIKRAKENSHENMWATMIQNLDKQITWRFWSRLMTRSLPTNHKLSKMANSGKDNII